MQTSASGESILVVDDDASIRQIVRLCLADEGYEVFEACNGQEALEAIDRLQPSLILLDLRMPVMDGWEFARRYRATPGPHAPIVAFVASLNATRDCAELASAGVLGKPFDIEELLTTVRNQLPVPR